MCQSVSKSLTNVQQTLAAETLVGIVRLHICPCTHRQRNPHTLAMRIMCTHKRRSAPRTAPLNRLYHYIHNTTFFRRKDRQEIRYTQVILIKV